MEYIIITLLIALMIEVYALQRKKTKLPTRGADQAVLVDTSALIDGRIVGVAESGFMPGQVIVPRSVLAELQLLADGSDHDKRSRARQGLDNVNELKGILQERFTLYNDEAPAREGVDARLLSLARAEQAAIITLDYNLNKVAQVEGVKILNVNELAKTLRMLHLPGDILTLHLTQKGQDSHQAVGHLPDGTMVVVEQAKRHIGNTEQVEVIRSLQTDAGKMMFAKLTTSASSEAPKKETVAAVKQSRGRRPVKAKAKAKAPEKARQTEPAAAQPTTPSDTAQSQQSQRSRQRRQPAAAGSSTQKTAQSTAPSKRTAQPRSAHTSTESAPQKRTSRRPKTSAQREDALMKLVEKQ